MSYELEKQIIKGVNDSIVKKVMKTEISQMLEDESNRYRAAKQAQDSFSKALPDVQSDFVEKVVRRQLTSIAQSQLIKREEMFGYERRR